MVTIKDIAKQAGVSYATVSRALNNKPEVKEKTRQLVHRVAKEMSYRPNAIARSLVTRQSKTIGLIIPDITNPFFPEVARGVEDALSQYGYNVLLCNTNWDENRECAYLEALESKRVDGLILESVAEDGQALVKLQKTGMPLVMINNVRTEIDSHHVIIDNVRGGYLVTNHLLWLGHKNIAFIGGMQHVKATEERLNGYKLALAERELPLNESHVLFGSFKRESGNKMARAVLKNSTRPTAIFAANDVLALGVLQAAHELQLKVPDDLAVVGFDDIEFASYPEVSLTTVAQPKYKLGEVATTIILEQIRKGISENRSVILQPNLIVRKSCGNFLCRQSNKSTLS